MRVAPKKVQNGTRKWPHVMPARSNRGLGMLEEETEINIGSRRERGATWQQQGCQRSQLARPTAGCRTWHARTCTVHRRDAGFASKDTKTFWWSLHRKDLPANSHKLVEWVLNHSWSPYSFLCDHSFAPLRLTNDRHFQVVKEQRLAVTQPGTLAQAPAHTLFQHWIFSNLVIFSGFFSFSCNSRNSSVSSSGSPPGKNVGSYLEKVTDLNM